jgi:hypothetical protein
MNSNVHSATITPTQGASFRLLWPNLSVRNALAHAYGSTQFDLYKYDLEPWRQNFQKSINRHGGMR